MKLSPCRASSSAFQHPVYQVKTTGMTDALVMVGELWQHSQCHAECDHNLPPEYSQATTLWSSGYLRDSRDHCTLISALHRRVLATRGMNRRHWILNGYRLRTVFACQSRYVPEPAEYSYAVQSTDESGFIGYPCTAKSNCVNGTALASDLAWPAQNCPMQINARACPVHIACMLAIAACPGMLEVGWSHMRSPDEPETLQTVFSVILTVRSPCTLECHVVGRYPHQACQCYLSSTADWPVAGTFWVPCSCWVVPIP